MNIENLLNNEGDRRRAFPVADDKVFLAHAAVSPLPRRVGEAIRAYARASERGDQEAALPVAFLAETRDLAAKLLGAERDEIALIGPTSLGLSLVANGLQCAPGDNVVCYFDDYPSNVYPWMALAGRGVETRFVRTAELGRIEVEDVLREVDGRTRLVSLASCHFVAGWRPDLRTIGAELQSRGVRFCVDGIQTLGAFPLDLEGLDFVAADAHKWLLGPCGAGLLYVRRAVQEELQPSVYGWHNLKCPDFVAEPELNFRPDARRYEAGTASLLPLVGMRAALELLLETGIPTIARELHRKRRYLVAQLQERGMEVLCADVPDAKAGGLVSFRPAGGEAAALHRRLTAEGIITSLRTDRQQRQFIRLSPHFYNTDEELARCLDALGRG